ncbi:MAG TPA: UDP-N-acetylmuramoyl-tripeptide--D-alanyl-D-alanine ligase [Candidatus Pullilachnospira intestinigallinarum]|nr:UDP-N-acetylmuramoyl-tripeptide--D-alanyl-D-alanine ligase [Candidatus Pullilachnospira intestinigallinarum]
MKNLTLENIAAACGGTYQGPEHLRQQCVSSITTDSRKTEPGCLFVPIVGSRADGHDFIPQVMEAGALASLSEKDLKDAPYPVIRVQSSLQAVKDIAAYYLKQLDIPVVGITGSVGKTSTKEAIASVLSQKYRVLKTQGNFNNELGLPLTVFRLRQEDEIAVLEMGISDFGEMHRLASIARPDICVITNIGCCHLENLGDRDGVFRAKTEIFDHLKGQGTVILNGDDDKLAAVKQVQGKPPVFFGLEEKHPIHAGRIESRGLKGTACTICTPVGDFDVIIPIPGQHMVYNALAGTAVGLAFGLDLDQIRRGIESLQPVNGRFHMIETDQYTIVDDCYNANPMSMKASLQILRDALGRKVAVLGDMGELGIREDALHAEVGTFAASCGLDLLICTGPHCAYMAQAARKAGMEQVVHLESLEELLNRLPGLVKEGDTILVKASHYMHFEKVVDALQNS